MTVAANSFSLGNGDDVTDTFTFDFKIFQTDEILVQNYDSDDGTITTYVEDTDYTVTISTVAEGGTITFETASIPAADTYVLMTYNLPFTQDTSFSYNIITTSTLNNTLDRLAMQDLELRQLLDQSAKVSSYALDQLGFDPTLPDPSEYADYFIKYNSAGTAFEAVAGDDSGISDLEEDPNPTLSNDLDYNGFGLKNSVNDYFPVKPNGGAGASFRLYDLDESNYVELAVPDIVTANSKIMYPAAPPAAAGMVMASTDTSGTVDWVEVETHIDALESNLDVAGYDFTNSVDYFYVFQGTGSTGAGIRLNDADNAEYFGIRSPNALTASYQWLVPDTVPSAGDIMTFSDGTGTIDYVDTLSSLTIDTITTDDILVNNGIAFSSGGYDITLQGNASATGDYTVGLPDTIAASSDLFLKSQTPSGGVVNLEFSNSLSDLTLTNDFIMSNTTSGYDVTVKTSDSMAEDYDVYWPTTNTVTYPFVDPGEKRFVREDSSGNLYFEYLGNLPLTGDLILDNGSYATTLMQNNAPIVDYKIEFPADAPNEAGQVLATLAADVEEFEFLTLAVACSDTTVQTGTEDYDYLTPDNVTFSNAALSAHGRWNATTGAIDSGSLNLSSVTVNSGGDYEVAFSTDMLDTNYSAIVTTKLNDGVDKQYSATVDTFTVSDLQVKTYSGSDTTTSGNLSRVMIQVAGKLSLS